MPDTREPPPDARGVLDFWFGALDVDGLAGDEQRKRWWRKDPAFDAVVRERFEPTWRVAARGGHDSWDVTAQGAVALVIVLDQLPRNMFRDRPEMFATDERARRIVLQGIESGRDLELVSDLGAFFYLPLMHSESRIDQHLGMRMYAELLERSPAGAREAIADNLDFMRRHFEIVDRFGRFPHRNAVLGRQTTPEEAEFLDQPGSSF